LTTSHLRHRLVLATKALLFAGRGEPYRIDGKTLRFVPGTRPVRLQYRTSDNAVNRNDAMQLAWMVENLAEGDFAVDVGANCGQCAVVMAAKCGANGTIIVFEPNPHARAVLTRNFDLNPSVKRATIEDYACSDTSAGKVTLYHNGNAANSALVALGASLRADAVLESFEVPVTTLDDYLSQRRLPEPRLVKIDTEGAEIRILKGAAKLLDGRSSILCELHPYAWPQFGNSFQELNELLERHGRRMRYLDREGEVGHVAEYGIVTMERF
jgi:FkbM family methyltransferase